MSFTVKVPSAVSGPFPSTDTYRGPQEVVDHELSLSRKKFKAQPLVAPEADQSNGQAGKMKRRAMTPGTSPAGS